MAAADKRQLLALAEQIVAESNAPEARNLDARKWLAAWLRTPLPALGGRRPEEFLGTRGGLKIVKRTLSALQSGVYL